MQIKYLSITTFFVVKESPCALGFKFPVSRPFLWVSVVAFMEMQFDTKEGAASASSAAAPFSLPGQSCALNKLSKGLACFKLPPVWLSRRNPRSLLIASAYAAVGKLKVSRVHQLRNELQIHCGRLAYAFRLTFWPRRKFHVHVHLAPPWGQIKKGLCRRFVYVGHFWQPSTPLHIFPLFITYTFGFLPKSGKLLEIICIFNFFQ